MATNEHVTNWENSDNEEAAVDVITNEQPTTSTLSPAPRLSLFQTPVIQTAPPQLSTVSPFTPYTTQTQAPPLTAFPTFGEFFSGQPPTTPVTPQISTIGVPQSQQPPASLYPPFITPQPQTSFNQTPTPPPWRPQPVAPSPNQWILEQKQKMMAAIDEWAKQSEAAYQFINPPQPSPQPVWTPSTTQPAIHVQTTSTYGDGGPLVTMPPPSTDSTEDLSRPYRPRAFTENSKFTTRIAQATFPPKLKMPTTIGKYDGNSDPDDHLNVFYTAGGVEGWPMPVWCHMFVQTLAGAARVWFDSLPGGQINSFTDFTDKFSAQFSQQK